jgi:nucleoid-associated protein YgaU
LAAQLWVFKQLYGGKKTITLGGYAAPFGRPRQQPVLKEKYVARINTVRYPGAREEPTRHIMGSHWEDFELSGRWMDKVLGAPGRANDLADEFIRFIRDSEVCDISWGNIVSYVGFIESIELSRESPNEIAWKINVLVDERPLSGKRNQNAADKFDNKTKELAKAVGQTFLSFAKPQNEKIAKDWQPDLFDQIDGLIGTVANYTSTFTNLANQIDNLKKATFSELRRLRGALHNIRTAQLQLQATLESIPSEQLVFTQESYFMIQSQAYRMNARVAIDNSLAILADLERIIDIEERGLVANSYTAKDGDTWESIAVAVYGDPTKFDKLRRANNIKYGEQPVPGKTYQVPR